MKTNYVSQTSNMVLAVKKLALYYENIPFSRLRSVINISTPVTTTASSIKLDSSYKKEPSNVSLVISLIYLQKAAGFICVQEALNIDHDSSSNAKFSFF